MRWTMTAALCWLVWPAFAQPQPGDEDDSIYYLHVKIGASDIDEDAEFFRDALIRDFGARPSEISFFEYDLPDLAISVTEGLRLSKHAAIEGSLVYFGEGDVIARNVSGDETYRLDFKAFTFSATALGRLPINRYLSAYGKAGFQYGYIELDLTLGGGPDEDVNKDEFAPLFGAGFQANFASGLSLDLSWEQSALDDLDVSTVWLGVGFRF